MTRFDPRVLRDAFGTFMTGVTVVTSHDGQGAPIGFTANSFTSVSLDPPLLLISLSKGSSNFKTLTDAPGFAVNILSENQEDLSNRFSRPVDDRFADLEWHSGPYGSPLLRGVTAWFDCSMHKTVDAGDHVLLIGEVEAFDNNGLNGLGYVGGSYIRPSLEIQATETALQESAVRIGAVLEHQGEVLLSEKEGGGLDLPFAHAGRGGTGWSHVERLADLIGPSVSVGFIYSVYEDAQRGTHNIIYRCSLPGGATNAGRLFNIQELPLDQVEDPASREILKRFQREYSQGNFGVYIGNEHSGEVHRLTKGHET
ncbi:MAG: flavin reductase family protein [Pseudomonadota bacterium]